MVETLPRFGRNRREWLVLLASGLTALGLVGVALERLPGARLAGQRQLEDQARESAREAQAQIQIWSRSERPEQQAQWLGAAPLEPGPEERAVREVADFPERGFDGLDVGLSALEASEPEDPLAALQQLIEVHPDAPRRPEALLMGLRIAVELGAEPTIETWLTRIEQEVDGATLHQGWPIRMLALVLAEARLPASVLAQRAEQEARAWATGEIRLAPPQDRWAQALESPEFQDDPRYGVLATTLERLGADAGTLRDAAHLEDRRAQAWLAVPECRERAIEAPEGAWTPASAATAGLYTRRTGATLALAQLPPGAPFSALETQPGFGFRGLGVAADPSAWLGPSLELPAGWPEVRLVHRDPDRFVRQERARRWPLSIALLLLAAAIAVTGWATARALARERRLAALRLGFVAGVSHDLRTPLAALSLLTENLEQGRVPEAEQRARYFPALARETRRLRRRVEDLLDFSRLERGLPPRLAVETTELGPLVEGLAQELGEEARRAGVELEFKAEGLPDTLDLDPDALRRVLANLTANALRHSGTEKLTIELCPIEGGLEARVRDYGRGIPAAKRGQAFEAFRQLEGSSPSAGGVGLGLSIVRSLAEAHGGRAELLDCPGPGTLVQVSFLKPV